MISRKVGAILDKNAAEYALKQEQTQAERLRDVADQIIVDCIAQQPAPLPDHLMRQYS